MKISFLNSIVCLFLIPHVYADDKTTAIVSYETPAIEFLEFLASWEDDKGQWQDPINFIDDSLVSLEQNEDDDDE